QLILDKIGAFVIKNYIRLYLKSRLSNIPTDLELEDYMGRDWALKRKLDCLIERSGSLFIYAATISSFLADEVLSATWQPSAALDNIYSCVLLNALPKLPTQLVARVYHIIGIIIILGGSLSLIEVENLLGERRGSVRSALQKLHSVILTPDTDDAPARVYHKSFPDYLIDLSRSG
ncbi:hypothetical protein FRB97_009294, partial [Tulasnella sp. 331]